LRRAVPISDDQSKRTVQHFNPFATRWYWIAVLFMTPIWAVWMFAHPPSFVIVNGTVAAVGPVIVALLAGVRQKDWRFIALGLAYALFIYWQGRGWLW
jgi:hypothetical protein